MGIMNPIFNESVKIKIEKTVKDSTIRLNTEQEKLLCAFMFEMYKAGFNDATHSVELMINRMK